MGDDGIKRQKSVANIHNYHAVAGDAVVAEDVAARRHVRAGGLAVAHAARTLGVLLRRQIG